MGIVFLRMLGDKLTHYNLFNYVINYGKIYWMSDTSQTFLHKWFEAWLIYLLTVQISLFSAIHKKKRNTWIRITNMPVKLTVV